MKAKELLEKIELLDDSIPIVNLDTTIGELKEELKLLDPETELVDGISFKLLTEEETNKVKAKTLKNVDIPKRRSPCIGCVREFKSKAYCSKKCNYIQNMKFEDGGNFTSLEF